MSAEPLLGPGDPAPVGVLNPEADSPFVLVCDHAGNAIPAALERLGLPPEERERHIAIDLGALAVATELAERLAAPLVFQRYSRLVIDSNRRPDVAGAMPEISDGTEIPGNRDLDGHARQARIDAIHRPYHERIAALLEARAAAGRSPVFVSVHSFTPRLRVRPADRPWHVGLCWGEDDRFSHPVHAALRAERELVIGWNQPYNVDVSNDYSIPVHAEPRGLPYVEFEMRQDLLQTPAQTSTWAQRLERVLRRALAEFDPD